MLRSTYPSFGRRSSEEYTFHPESAHDSDFSEYFKKPNSSAQETFEESGTSEIPLTPWPPSLADGNQIYDVRAIPASSSQAAPKVSPGSDEYYAAFRRRQASEIRNLIKELAPYTDRVDDFVVYTNDLADMVKRALVSLEHAPEEGNTREILRWLRDSVIDGNWERYKEPEVRAAATAIVSSLGNDWVTKEDAFKAVEAMEGLGFSAVSTIPFPFSFLDLNEEDIGCESNDK